MIYIIEGVDNVGKGTLIDSIQNRLGFHTVIKYDKPKELEHYKGFVIEGHSSIKMYQHESFVNGFSLIHGAITRPTPPRLIFDRFHLGEMVYSPIYRGYSGDYVMQLEQEFLYKANALGRAADRIKLILLTARDPSKLPDDGKSFDFTKINNEQNLFKDAFRMSRLPKKIIEVQNEDFTFKKPAQILKEIW